MRMVLGEMTDARVVERRDASVGSVDASNWAGVIPENLSQKGAGVISRFLHLCSPPPPPPPPHLTLVSRTSALGLMSWSKTISPLSASTVTRVTSMPAVV